MLIFVCSLEELIGKKRVTEGGGVSRHYFLHVDAFILLYFSLA